MADSLTPIQQEISHCHRHLGRTLAGTALVAGFVGVVLKRHYSAVAVALLGSAWALRKWRHLGEASVALKREIVWLNRLQLEEPKPVVVEVGVQTEPLPDNRWRPPSPPLAFTPITMNGLAPTPPPECNIDMSRVSLDPDPFDPDPLDPANGSPTLLSKVVSMVRGSPSEKGANSAADFV